MNIDYAAIIVRADARKDALQKFENAVTNLRAEINETGDPELITALYEYKTKYDALDLEAIQLLPDEAGRVLWQFAAGVLNAWNQLEACNTYSKITAYEALEKLSQE